MILTFEILFQFSKSPFIWTIKFKLNIFVPNKSENMEKIFHIRSPYCLSSVSAQHLQKPRKHHFR